MKFDIHLRSAIKQQIEDLAQKMQNWEDQPRLDYHEKQKVLEKITPFSHTTKLPRLRISGVDGSGDFPSIAYGDTFIYVSVAQGVVYELDNVTGLREVAPAQEPIVHFLWLPENTFQRENSLQEGFSFFANMPIEEVIKDSDYLAIKRDETGKKISPDDALKTLIYPHAADAGNLGLQLRSSAELGAALQLIETMVDMDYVLIDGTLSLPLVNSPTGSLFHEYLKRLCCVKATEKGIGFLAISKSHGLPSIELIEELAREKQGLPAKQIAEHWYLRLPMAKTEGWKFSLAEERQIPPPGAVTYLMRFHRTTPVMRLDVDAAYWRKQVAGRDESETSQREQKLFEDLDYSSHDQRSFGYPYPIKAGHDRSSLTRAERVALRKQIQDAAVKAGMKRALFRNPSIETGHE